MKHSIEKTAEGTRLTLEGRLDTLSASELEKAVAEIVQNPGKSVEVAIDGLTYISSSGLRCFVQLYNSCRKAGAPMTVSGMQPAVKEIFDLTGFSKIFGV